MNKNMYFSMLKLNVKLNSMRSIRKKKKNRSSYCGAVETNPTSIHEDVGWISGLTPWVKDPVLP